MWAIYINIYTIYKHWARISLLGIILHSIKFRWLVRKAFKSLATRMEAPVTKNYLTSFFFIFCDGIYTWSLGANIFFDEEVIYFKFFQAPRYLMVAPQCRWFWYFQTLVVAAPPGQLNNAICCFRRWKIFCGMTSFLFQQHASCEISSPCGWKSAIIARQRSTLAMG